MAHTRHFFPWDRPLLPQAVEFLAGSWTGKGPLNLADVLVVVPTRQAGRRLREALAAFAAKRDAAVFPPRVMLPESLVSAGAPPAGIASRLESQLAWIDLFRRVDLEEFRAVFPVDPPARNFSWARRIAQEFGRLQSTLAEAGLKLADVPAKVGENFPESERWEQMGVLEERYAAKLAALGRKDAQAAKLDRARAPALPDGIRRIVVMGTPDPLPLAVTILGRHAENLPVDIAVFAPESEAGTFDEWGRPLGSVWEDRVLDLPEFERRVRLCSDPEDQAAKVGAAAAGYGEPEGLLGVGVADAEVLPLLENVLAHAGIRAFNPEGRPRRGDRLFQLLTALAGLAREDSFASVETLARCPDFLEFLRGRKDAGFSAAGFLTELDALHARHLPPDLREARRQCGDRLDLAAVAELRATLTTGRFPESASAALAAIFGTQQFNLNVPADALAAEAAETWTDLMREIASAAEKFSEVANDEWWELALGFYGESVRYDEKTAGAVELQGWLELLWEDAPHLVVAGCNDGRVPDAVVGDPFLPEALRGPLGLKTNAARLARDAYLLQALAKCRAGNGRLDLLVGKTSVAGDPLRPSRLLFRCADQELPDRVAFLFRPAETARSNPAWRRAWQLTPPRVIPPKRIAVTALSRWLQCPFRFYLSRVLKLDAVDPAKAELDALDFGSLCHGALEEMGREPALRDCTDPAVIRDFLLAALARRAADALGAELTLPLLVQLESARQRLGRAAEVQAQIRAEGWVIIDVERALSLEIGETRLTGKIDRIDRHKVTGLVRVLDYKTSDQPARPGDAHLRILRREEQVPPYSRYPDGGGPLVWSDLQLPLYLRKLAADYPQGVTAGYFNLPKASTETGLSLWHDYTAAHAESAWRCAEGVVQAIAAGKFWPPSETIPAEVDEFASLFHHGAEASVAWEGPAR
ncbi:MAG: ATP-dependent nuclease subunit B-like protein [Verrucomicrobia bacterium]|nr:ATP-dependent nuclease subunit B-like protein [Verrucomicrobiota bacterium]